MGRSNPLLLSKVVKIAACFPGFDVPPSSSRILAYTVFLLNRSGQRLSSRFNVAESKPVRCPRHSTSFGCCSAKNSTTASGVISSTTQASLTPMISFCQMRPNFSANCADKRKHFVKDSVICSPRNSSIKAGTFSVVLS